MILEPSPFLERQAHLYRHNDAPLDTLRFTDEACKTDENGLVRENVARTNKFRPPVNYSSVTSQPVSTTLLININHNQKTCLVRLTMEDSLADLGISLISGEMSDRPRKRMRKGTRSCTECKRHFYLQRAARFLFVHEADVQCYTRPKTKDSMYLSS